MRLKSFFFISVTLSVFPGVCASIQSSSDDEFSQKWFSPILTMLLYNFGDTLGRLATAMVQINKRTDSFKILWNSVPVRPAKGVPNRNNSSDVGYFERI